MADNPYAAPTADVSEPATGEAAEAESVRRAHLSHETNIRGVGALYILGGVLVLISGFSVGVTLIGDRGNELGVGFAAGLAAVLLLLAVAQIWNGVALRRLRPGARIPGVLLGILTLLNFPIGTLIGAFILYLLLSAKGKTVLSDEYAKVRELTPHIRYRTSVIIWILLALVILGVVAAVMVPMMNR